METFTDDHVTAATTVLISAAADAAEREAHRAADYVLIGEQALPIAEFARSTTCVPLSIDAAAAVRKAIVTEGAPLDAATRLLMERHFDCDLSHIRIHADATAARSAMHLGVRAYAYGRHVVFARGAYAPHTGEGRHLIAHEIAHCLQQERAGVSIVQPWVAAGALGWSVASAALQNSGDISYAFDKWTGTKFPNDDVAGYTGKHKFAIVNGSQEIAVWIGTSDHRKSGIKFAIDYEYDGYSIGAISMRLLDTYDWPLWGGSYNVNITPLRQLSGDGVVVRFTVNALWDATFKSGGDSANFSLDANNGFTRTDSSSDIWIEGAGITVAAAEVTNPQETQVASNDGSSTSSGGSQASSSDGSPAASTDSSAQSSSDDASTAVASNDGSAQASSSDGGSQDATTDTSAQASSDDSGTQTASSDTSAQGSSDDSATETASADTSAQASSDDSGTQTASAGTSAQASSDDGSSTSDDSAMASSAA